MKETTSNFDQARTALREQMLIIMKLSGASRLRLVRYTNSRTETLYGIVSIGYWVYDKDTGSNRRCKNVDSSRRIQVTDDGPHTSGQVTYPLVAFEFETVETESCDHGSKRRFHSSWRKFRRFTVKKCPKKFAPSARFSSSKVSTQCVC